MPNGVTDHLRSPSPRRIDTGMSLGEDPQQLIDDYSRQTGSAVEEVERTFPYLTTPTILWPVMLSYGPAVEPKTKPECRQLFVIFCSSSSSSSQLLSYKVPSEEDFPRQIKSSNECNDFERRHCGPGEDSEVRLPLKSSSLRHFCIFQLRE